MISAPPGIGNLQIVLARAMDVDPAAFRVFATLEVPLPRGRAVLHVIGASSLVRVEWEGRELAEVIACAPGAVVERPISASRIRGIVPASAALAAATGQFSYSARLWTTLLEEEPFSGVWQHRLEHRFPGPVEPLTRIEALPLPTGLRLRTRHDYPEAGLAAWSESEWSFPRDDEPVPPGC